MWVWLRYIIRHGLWAPVAVLVIDTLLDFTFDIYANYPNYDILSHAVGGASIAYMFGAAYRAPNSDRFLGKHSKFSFFLFSLSFCGLVCIGWEFFEWLSDRNFATDFQLGQNDTMGDFFFGLLGAGLVSFWIARKVG